MRSALTSIADLAEKGSRWDSFPWHNLRYQQTQAIRAKLASAYAPATANRFMAALRGVLKECNRLGYIDADTYQRAIDLRPIKGSSAPRGRAVPMDELRTLFAGCKSDSRLSGTRDLALLAVAFSCGLRRAELVALELTDYEADTGALIIRHGKGNKRRAVYLADGSKTALEQWLEARGQGPGPIFLRMTKGGRLSQSGLSAQAVYLILRERAEFAAIEKLAPYDCRRTFSSELLDAGVDITTVASLAGHANVQTTAKYDRRGERAKMAAVRGA